MHRRFTLFLILCLMALALPATHAQATLPVFEPGPCPVRFSGSTQVECGVVTVPQDRANPDESSIQLAVAVFKARSDTPAPDPVLFLDGGPGARTLDSFGGGLGSSFLGRINQQRDVVLFDYRGIGYSDPALTCPEAAGAEGTDWVADCRDRHAANGVDVTHFTTRDNAADAADIMRALGYDNYNIWGGSYGSSVAQALLRDHPEGIRMAIITALQGLQGDLQSTRPAYLVRTLDMISALCQEDAECAAAFPGSLTESLFAAAANLDASPIPVNENGVTGQVDGMVALGVLSEMLKDEQNLPVIPGFIATLASGNADALKPYVAMFAPPSDPLNPYGAWLSMRCTDSILLPTPEVMERALAALPPALRAPLQNWHSGQVAQCTAWGARLPSAEDRLPAETNIPVVIVSGALDPFSSQEWLDETLATLPNGYGYLLPYHAHYVVHNPCTSSMLIGFLNDPETPPDASCMADIPAPTFQTP